MTQVDTARPGMRLFVLENGTFVDAQKCKMVSGVDESVLFDFPCWTVLIEHPDGNIVFDAACHDDAYRQVPFFTRTLHMEPDDRMPVRVEQAGFRITEIAQVVISHMHPDHIGYLDCFPDAQVIVSDAEFTNTMRDYGLGSCEISKDLDRFMHERIDWRLLPDDVETTELARGVTVYSFGSGHSYGMLGLLVRLPRDGNKLLVSDAVYSAENAGPPVREPEICHDPAGWRRTLARIREIARDEEAEIWYGHDMAQFDSLLHSDEGWYE